MFVYLLVTFATLSYLWYKYFTRTFNYWKDKGVVGPEPVPFFGNIKESARRRKNIGILFKEIYENFPNEKVVGVYRMTTPCLLIRDADIVKHIMIKDFDVFVDRGIEFSKKGLGQNLFHADGETWHVLRNRFSPIFTSGKLKNMLYLMTERGDTFVEYIEGLSENQPEHEVHSLVQKFTIATILACAFGLDINTMAGDKMKTLKKIDHLTLTPNYAQELDMMYPGVLKRLNMSLLPSYVKNTFETFVKRVINQRNGLPSNRKDLMDLILELRQQGEVQSTKRNADDKQLLVELTDDIITAQCFVFYVGGYETSATTMSFMLYELAKNPDVQDKVQAEIDSVLEKHNGQVTYEALNEMVYLENVFSETLRFYAVVEPLQRNAQKDYQIPGTNVTIEKGTTVLISALGLHHDTKYWTNPEKFDPDRFTPENSKNRHPCAYIPFGTGPRNCIGMRFAKFQSKVCMVKLLSKFRVDASKNTQQIMTIHPNRVIIGPAGGIHLNIVKRK